MSYKNSKYWDDSQNALMYDDYGYETLEDIAAMGMLRLCGCVGDDLLPAVSRILRDLKRPEDGEWVGWGELCEKHFSGSKDIGYLVLSYLDCTGIIEHGSSIRGSWLTRKGEELLDLLNEIEAQ